MSLEYHAASTCAITYVAVYKQEKDRKKEIDVASHRLACQFTSAKPKISSFMELAFLFTVCEMRFLFGDISVLIDFREAAKAALKKLDFSALVSLYEGDPFRSSEAYKFGSEHYHVIKRGAGGFIDIEFLWLICRWGRLRGEPTVNCRIIQVCSWKLYRYLSFLKCFLREASAGPLESTLPLYRAWVEGDPPRIAGTPIPWFFNPSIIDRVRLSQVHILEAVMQIFRRGKNG